MVNVHFLDPPGPPSAPEPTEVTKESCQLTWKAPESDGGSPVTGYFIERAQKGSSRWLRCNKQPVSDTNYKVTDLIEDTEYIFRIVAVNKIGEGPPGPESVPVRAKDPFGKNMFLLTEAITFLIKNILTNRISQYFKSQSQVPAFHLLSKSSIESLSNLEKPGKPDPPEIVQVNKNSVSLRWKPPRDDGGAEITNYVIEYRIEGSNYMLRSQPIEFIHVLKFF